MEIESKLFWGVDIGAETVKIAVLTEYNGKPHIHKTYRKAHDKDPFNILRNLLCDSGWTPSFPIAATGRFSRGLTCLQVPVKAALSRGIRFTHPDIFPCTVISIGSQGFSVLEMHCNGQNIYRENSRCSQGTGNFLCQLVERFGLNISEASQKCASVENPVILSGRCPVILKTDMTHLANKGEDIENILAGLFDAVCTNVQSLLKPDISPDKIILTGGVTQSDRIRRNFTSFSNSRHLSLIENNKYSTHFSEALGAAIVAFEQKTDSPEFDDLFREKSEHSFEHVTPLRKSLEKVQRIPAASWIKDAPLCDVILGFDIGSTGSKALAVNSETLEPVWEAYLNTQGDPIVAAQRLVNLFLKETTCKHKVRNVGVTGSGREIVGSLMKSCYGTSPITIMNEIAAHAEGALYFDPEVDTIFEIGGQDAKYSRLEDGHIIDAAMNEACSAGTGSFIAEQGGRFDGINNVTEMDKIAMEAEYGVSLGQHCSVFMAEVIAAAISERIPQPSIVAGLYDSIALNYLNRVKGSRSVGKKIFCQGMPFKSDSLPAAIANRTGQKVIIPPNPGTIGALGIALIAGRQKNNADHDLDMNTFLGAAIVNKDTFNCKSNRGCGGNGNNCRIERIKTIVQNKEKMFLWGGNCSLYEKGHTKTKLPDLTPDPFVERRKLISELISSIPEHPDRPTIALVEEFSLKNWLPFFLYFFDELGFNVKVYSDKGIITLKQGIENSNVPFCAPMQLYQGIVSKILKSGSEEFFFSPRLRENPRHGTELHACNCPIVQASPDLVYSKIFSQKMKILDPCIDIGIENFQSKRFIESVKELAGQLGKNEYQRAFDAGCRAQLSFEKSCRDSGRKALEFAAQHDLKAVVVIGRSYTIHNDILNANVPNLLREQGALAIPLDCYPISDETPVFPEIYWGSSQSCLRAAHQIRRSPGQYAVYCSNYSCGPDSFTLHFFAYIMENKPFTIIETDGHSGDAGTKTRIEAFLYCVSSYIKKSTRATNQGLNDFRDTRVAGDPILNVRNTGETLMVPRMGPCAETIAALLNAEGVRAEALALGTKEDLQLARKYTSGKECIPMAITLGSFLTRVLQAKDTDERFAFLLPGANGPCRFGMYNILQNIIFDKIGLSEKVRIISPSDEDYFAEVPVDFQLRALACFIATDMLQAALHDVRPVEKIPGETQKIYDRYIAELKDMMVRLGSVGTFNAFRQVWSGCFGLKELLTRAGEEFSKLKDFEKNIPTVAVVGEIYVRLDTFANNDLVLKLEERGLRCVLAPFSEWLVYCTLNERDRCSEKRPLPGDSRLGSFITHTVQRQIIEKLHKAVGSKLGWGTVSPVEDIVQAATPYINPALIGEAVLSLGGPLHELRHDKIIGTVTVGPHECMPNKIVESQFQYVNEDTGLICLALAVNGESLNPELLDRFAFEVYEKYEKNR
ncbi:acyl-CoA dehydratase activase-related protein [Maridesulfovibrio sp.]|uniref:acyl-CoA dehydratase activase-related protein n=1 Tax=Maridesulfovibrio sp. TaxID=2795000 RepID=UPI0029F557CF|nr:acyl-CoA dehydratase activase-related protein [Maridesulfovibrio sp.]